MRIKMSSIPHYTTVCKLHGTNDHCCSPSYASTSSTNTCSFLSTSVHSQSYGSIWNMFDNLSNEENSNNSYEYQINGKNTYPLELQEGMSIDEFLKSDPIHQQDGDSSSEAVHTLSIIDQTQSKSSSRDEISNLICNNSQETHAFRSDVAKLEIDNENDLKDNNIINNYCSQEFANKRKQEYNFPKKNSEISNDDYHNYNLNNIPRKFNCENINVKSNIEIFNYGVDISVENKQTNNVSVPSNFYLQFNSKRYIKNTSRKVVEDDTTAEWYKHKRHVFIFSYSGKPIFSRYGTTDKLSAFTGTLAAIISKMSSFFVHSKGNDRLKYISAGDHCFAFIERGPLWLVSIACRGESYRQLEKLLIGVHDQLMSILTRGIDRTLYARPNYDVRNLLGGTETVVSNYISSFSREMFSVVGGFESLPLNVDIRNLTTNILKDFRTTNVLSGILLAQNRVASITVSKLIKLYASDIIVIINLVMSSTSLRQTESWIPVCLPNVNENAFLYAYVNYLSPDIGLVFLSSSSNEEQFYALSHHFKRCCSLLEGTGCLAAIKESLMFCPYNLPESIWGFLELIHIAYYIPSNEQYFAGAFKIDYEDNKKMKRVYDLYNKSSNLLLGAKQPSSAFIESKHERVFVWHSPEFYLFVAVPRWIELSTIILNQLANWLKEQSSFLFILKIPTI